MPSDCLTICLYKHSCIKQLIRDHNVTLFCKLPDQLVDKHGCKAKKTKHRKSYEEMSVRKGGFYVDFLKLSRCIESDPAFKNLLFAPENLGVLSMMPGNDKIPSFRGITKNLAFTSFRSLCSQNLLMDIVNADGNFDDSHHCQLSFKKVFLCLYAFMYRTTIRNLGLTPMSFLTGETINWRLLQEVGVKHCRGKEFMYAPDLSILNPNFKRTCFQAAEYDQIFVESLPMTIHSAGDTKWSICH